MFDKFQNLLARDCALKRIFNICECHDSHVLKHERISKASAYVPFVPNLKIRACLQKTFNIYECQNYPCVNLIFWNLRIYELVVVFLFSFKPYVYSVFFFSNLKICWLVGCCLKKIFNIYVAIAHTLFLFSEIWEFMGSWLFFFSLF